MVENAQIQDHIERTSHRLWIHVPEIEDTKLHIATTYDLPYETRLVDKLSTRIKTDNLSGTKERALDRPKTGVAPNVKHSLALKIAPSRLQEPRHEMAKPF